MPTREITVRCSCHVGKDHGCGTEECGHESTFTVEYPEVDPLDLHQHLEDLKFTPEDTWCKGCDQDLKYDVCNKLQDTLTDQEGIRP